MSYLPYIDDTNLVREVKRVVDVILNSKEVAERDLYKNVVDPFSALFDSFASELDLNSWLNKESSRQIQKSLQNRIGEFHQNILGNCHGWVVVDSVVDIKSDAKRIVAEIKNKHNTTKGSDKKVLYENLDNQLSTTFIGYIGYYVEVVPKSPTRYDIPFTPSDNILKARKEEREDIRKIDGSSFYELATGYEGALKMLYEVLPDVVEEITGSNFSSIKKDPLFQELFQKTYQ